nr:uncharacterized protein LOC117278610 [Nicotiana tomentosiformis]
MTVTLPNNEAKYETLIAGLELPRGLNSEAINIKCDSHLVVNQDWRNEIIDYLEHGKLPKDPKASRALRTKTTRYSFEKGQIYRKLFQGPLARCLGASEANNVMREIHEGICGNHSSADSLLMKLVRAGHYWPRMELDAKDFVRKCDKCQCHTPLKTLEEAKGRWPEELPGGTIGLPNNCQIKHRRNSFFPCVWPKALIPVEVGEPTLRYSQANEESNNEAILINLELLEERRDLAHVRMEAQKKRMEWYYNQRTNLRYFKVEDLVLRKVTQNARELNTGKLVSTWEGLYRVSSITDKGL